MSKKRNSKFNLKRKEPYIPEKPCILIVSEGKNTEPSYFEKFKLSTLEVKTVGVGNNTLKVVKEAEKLVNKARLKGKNYEQVWCVFDKDDFTDNDFNKAIELAFQKEMRVAYSNQSFEYWIILHLKDHQGGCMDRSNYSSDINKLLPNGVSYDGSGSKKITNELFDFLLTIDEQTEKSYQQLAIERAKRLLKNKRYLKPSDQESITTVHLLVEELNKFI